MGWTIEDRAGRRPRRGKAVRSRRVTSCGDHCGEAKEASRKGRQTQEGQEGGREERDQQGVRPETVPFGSDLEGATVRYRLEGATVHYRAPLHRITTHQHTPTHSNHPSAAGSLITGSDNGQSPPLVNTADGEPERWLADQRSMWAPTPRPRHPGRLSSPPFPSLTSGEGGGRDNGRLSSPLSQFN